MQATKSDSFKASVRLWRKLAQGFVAIVGGVEHIVSCHGIESTVGRDRPFEILGPGMRIEPRAAVAFKVCSGALNRWRIVFVLSRVNPESLVDRECVVADP